MLLAGHGRAGTNTEEGRISVDVALGIMAALGTYLTAAPFWHEIVRITHEHARRRGASLLVRSAPYD
ncbi:hypothetical protein ACIBJD_21875 [Kitasatospora sp. NPDC050467]|uniref:hypothetical protein n=1 Tax=Kitasatospora sp. NPDC050467 TaxID=3364053 RepID=UPI0037946C1F